MKEEQKPEKDCKYKYKSIERDDCKYMSVEADDCKIDSEPLVTVPKPKTEPIKTPALDPQPARPHSLSAPIAGAVAQPKSYKL